MVMDGKKAGSRVRGKRLLGTTGGRILMLLCRRPHTVAELAADLGVSGNAVRAQLQRLERDGLVSQGGSRRGVRKPHVEYGLTAAAYELFPRAYEPVLRELVDVLAERLSGKALRTLFVQAGRRLLEGRLDPPRGRGPRQRLAQVVSKLNGSSFGIEVETDDGKTVVRSCSCPLASVTAAHPEVCEALANTLGELLGMAVHETCARGAQPRCCFVVEEGGKEE